MFSMSLVIIVAISKKAKNLNFILETGIGLSALKLKTSLLKKKNILEDQKKVCLLC